MRSSNASKSSVVVKRLKDDVARVSHRMKFEMKMPDLATTGSTMTLTRWLAIPGQTVQRGQKLLEVETDKAIMEVESTASGLLQETRLGPGESVSAGDIIAVFETDEVVSAKSVSQ